MTIDQIVYFLTKFSVNREGSTRQSCQEAWQQLRLGMIEGIGVAQPNDCHMDLGPAEVLFLDLFSLLSWVRTESGMMMARSVVGY
jgi:hypothetical protein